VGIPTRLYKYVAPERIDVLVNKKVRFTPACLLDDPFEFSPGMPVSEDGEPLGQVEQYVCEHHGPELRAKAHYYGVLSLALENDSIPMWTHYASGHQGFVIGFDTNAELSRDAVQNRKLDRVNYDADRPCLTRNCPSDRVLFRTKSKAWGHEKEWRWIECCDARNGFEFVPERTGGLIALRPIPPRSICEVILGCRASRELETSIRTLASTEDYRHLKLFKVVLDQSCYSFRVQDL